MMVMVAMVVMMLVVPPPPGLVVVLVVVVMMMVVMIAVSRGRLHGAGQRAGGDEDGDEAGCKSALEHDDLLDPLIEATIRLWRSVGTKRQKVRRFSGE